MKETVANIQLNEPVLDEIEKFVERDHLGEGKYYIAFEEKPPRKDISLYNHEQQAELIAFYYRFVILKDYNKYSILMQKEINYVTTVTRRFFVNSKEMDLLPINATNRKGL